MENIRSSAPPRPGRSINYCQNRSTEYREMATAKLWLPMRWLMNVLAGAGQSPWNALINRRDLASSSLVAGSGLAALRQKRLDFRT